MFTGRGRDSVLSGVAIGKEPLILKIIPTHASGSNPNESYCIIPKKHENKKALVGKKCISRYERGTRENEIHYYI